MIFLLKKRRINLDCYILDSRKKFIERSTSFDVNSDSTSHSPETLPGKGEPNKLLVTVLKGCS